MLVLAKSSTKRILGIKGWKHNIKLNKQVVDWERDNLFCNCACEHTLHFVLFCVALVSCKVSNTSSKVISSF